MTLLGESDLQTKCNRSENINCHTVTKRCTRQLALTVAKNVMFHSNQTVQGQFTAENATLNEDHHEDTKRKLNT